METKGPHGKPVSPKATFERVYPALYSTPFSHLPELGMRPVDLPHGAGVTAPLGGARPGRAPGVPRPHLHVLVRGAGGQLGAVPVEGDVVDQVAVVGGHHLGRVHRGGRGGDDDDDVQEGVCFGGAKERKEIFFSSQFSLNLSSL